MHHTNHHSLISSFLKNALLGAGLLTCSVMAFALPSDRNQPISLVADHATYNDKTGVTTYTGNVLIEQGTMKLQAASIVANLNKNKQISTITANGSPAKFQQQIETNRGIARGEAKKILYNAETGIITLIGNAYLNQDGASLRGSTLKYSMNKGDVEVSGSSSEAGSTKGRVQIIIPPSSSRTFQGVRD
ncbi:lipopolysaccharide transport periplasmic protein LptA [Acinetobacter shaoyimingii]|uniref:Lipopolysaccharide export system protein LptA n=1 Tax=Acinetobacter shaoyimingii TaxID=2715164 RepID=A0A6G8RUR7_9GAMM|nr:lipopolysaccharide transport periplasmic protein LptA [Acinetobacter shaoyimingii]NHB58551.1 lipopolysaccharide transport periplasmic protein LptA [Acinetobacter shaoyimingii]QIO05664.1 lipopolysaccharide transport periplasmic protein LptA [Acinetobacter shaoyimingii]